MSGVGATTTALIVAGLAILFVAFWLATRRSHAPLPPGGLLLTVECATTTDGAGGDSGLVGVEHEERLQCPRRARERLQQAERGVMYRDGADWVVATGRSLAVVSPPGRTLHYLRGNGPDLSGAANTGRGEAGPPDVPGFVAKPSSAVAANALIEGGGVQRFPTLAGALGYIQREAAGRDVLLLYNGPHDPAFYVVRLPVGVAPESAIVTAPGLPGTVYHRRPTQMVA